jgi:hypothetical protein
MTANATWAATGGTSVIDAIGNIYVLGGGDVGRSADQGAAPHRRRRTHACARLRACVRAFILAHA